MQFLLKTVIIFGILLLDTHYTDVPYCSTLGFFPILRPSRCAEFEGDPARQKFGKNPPNSTSQTHKDALRTVDSTLRRNHGEGRLGETNKWKESHGSASERDSWRETDPYSSLCFCDELALGEPLQLVYPNDDHTELILDTEVLKVLEQIPKPVYPVGIIGPVNSGKSFLLNLLNDNHFCTSSSDSSSQGSQRRGHQHTLEAGRTRLKARMGKGTRPKGFRVSRTPEPETFGIWVYSEPLRIRPSKLQERLRSAKDGACPNYYSLQTVVSHKEGANSTKLERCRSDGVGSNDSDPDEVVNVIFLDVEGLNSHKNVFKYDEAVFSIISSICSEVIYVANRTLNSADLQTLEELIKSSLLSKIANLYTLYHDMGTHREDREEVFQYFLKMFEHKNLTFMVNEFKFTPDQGFESLVNLLRAPKRDLSLHELYTYHKNGRQSVTYSDDLERRLRSHEPDDTAPGEDSRDHAQVPRGRGDVCSTVALGFNEVMFNSFGYIFHTLFKSVNMAVLPATSNNPFLQDLAALDGHEHGAGPSGNTPEEYLEQLRNFKSELFLRATRGQLQKYCVLDGVTSSCPMTGKDLAEMVRFTVKTLSLNRFYKLATNIGPVEGLAKIDYKDAFDEYFRVFRSTRLLMIKNDLYETYRTILNGYVQGGPREPLAGSEDPEEGPDSSASARRIPTMGAFIEYSSALKTQLLNLMVKNFENEATAHDFGKITQDLVKGFERVAELASAELSENIERHCTEAAEEVFKSHYQRLDTLKLPVLPSTLKFVHNIERDFRHRFTLAVDGDVEVDSVTGALVEGSGDLLTRDYVCVSVLEKYENLLAERRDEVVQRNQDMIDVHFKGVLERAVEHFRTHFTDVEENYQVPLSRALEGSAPVLKDAQNILVTHLGEFHALEMLVLEFKSKLQNRLGQELELFKRSYASKCEARLQSLHDHYVGNYKRFLNEYAPLPTDGETLIMYHEFLRHLARSEFFKLTCTEYSEIEKRHQRFEAQLSRRSLELAAENVALVTEALRPEFEKMDEYLVKQVPECRFYLYFYHNAHRYAKFTINANLVSSRLNIGLDALNPVTHLSVESVLLNPENARPSAAAPEARLGPNDTPAAHYDIDLGELNRGFIRLNPYRIQDALLGAVVKHYMTAHVPKFKRLFVQRYCNAAVLVCSITLLGMSALSFCLAQNGYSKLAFSALGFLSYSFLVGMESAKRTLRRVQALVERVAARALAHLMALLKLALRRALRLLASLARAVFTRLGVMYTFLAGFLSALALYLYSKLLLFRRRRSQRRRD